MKSYDHKKIEKKWQKEWEKTGVYTTKETEKKEKQYVLDMFPYPSGEGLHVGHPKGYIATDVFSRHARMQGKEVLHPMGWDAFGLPAENFAIKNKIHPRKAVEKNIKRFKEQLRMIGLDYDWKREINTTDPEFYKWTQWIFLKLYEKGLAYQSYEPINWCPTCQTGLSNEDLDGNVCERCGTVVEKRPMRQWILKITDYADRLLEDLELLPEWQEHIKESQRNWIGRSEGAEFDFLLNFANPKFNENRGPNGEKAHIAVFTTRADTLFGATYLVLAPEHPWMKLAIDDRHDVLANKEEVKKYVEAASKKTELERMAGDKNKTGIELKGAKAINPATGKEIPMYVADYALANYGTGAVMAVPAHDGRDMAFAKKFDIPVKQTIEPLIIRESGPDSVRADGPFVERNAIIAVIKRRSDQKYLCIHYRPTSTNEFVSGGIKGSESLEEAAIREIREETGYTNVSFIRELGRPVHSRYYRVRHQANTLAHYTPLLFELTGDERVEVSEDEKSRHEVKWLDESEVSGFINRDDYRYAWDRLQGKPYEGKGILFDSAEFSGLESDEALPKITEKFGRAKTTYKLRDWVFSRRKGPSTQ